MMRSDNLEPVDAPAGDPWAELRAEVEATNRWYDGDRPVNSVSAWVGFWPPTGWYGGAGFEGDCMEEVADASGATAGEAATMLVRLMREWRDRTDRERAEDDDAAFREPLAFHDFAIVPAERAPRAGDPGDKP